MSTQELDEVRPTRRRRAWYKRRDILFILVAAALWLGWEGYGYITGPTRLTPALEAELDKDPKNVEILVTAKFRPERFHSNVYNEHGVQRGTEDRTTLLVRVKPSGVRWLSRQYWIETIDIAPPQDR